MEIQPGLPVGLTTSHASGIHVQRLSHVKHTLQCKPKHAMQVVNVWYLQTTS